MATSAAPPVVPETNHNGPKIRTLIHETSAKKTHQPTEAVVSRLADKVSYWLVSASIYLTFGTIFYYAAREKLVTDNGTMPAGLAKTFQGTFVASFPGLNTSWVLIGILEAVVFVAFAVSVLRGEFLPTRRKPVLLSALGLSMITFALISWAESISGGNATVGSLFTYLAGTAVLFVLVLLMPPYRKTAWLSSLGGTSSSENESV